MFKHVHNVINLESSEAHNNQAFKNSHVQTPFLIGWDTLSLIVEDLIWHSLLDLEGIQRQLDVLVGLCKLDQLILFQSFTISVLRIVVELPYGLDLFCGETVCALVFALFCVLNALNSESNLLVSPLLEVREYKRVLSWLSCVQVENAIHTLSLAEDNSLGRWQNIEIYFRLLFTRKGACEKGAS